MKNFISFLLVFLLSFCFGQKKMYYTKIEKNGKYGIINTVGDTIVKPQFAWLGDFFEYDFSNRRDTVVFQEFPKDGGKFGLITNTGKIVVPAIYKFIENWNPKFWFAQKEDGTMVVMNRQNQVLETTNDILNGVQDSIVVSGKYGNLSFHKIGSPRKYGIFDNVKVDEKSRLIFVRDKKNYKNGALYDYNGNKIYEEEGLTDIEILRNTPFIIAKRFVTVVKDNRVFVRDLKTGMIKEIIRVSKGRDWGFPRICKDKKGKDSICSYNDIGTPFSVLQEFGEITNYGYRTFSDDKIWVIYKGTKMAFADKDGNVLTSFFDENKLRYDDRVGYLTNKDGKITGSEAVSEDGKVYKFPGYEIVSIFYDENLALGKKTRTENWFIFNKGKVIRLKSKQKLIEPALFAPSYNSGKITITSKNEKKPFGDFFTVDSKGKVEPSPFTLITNFYNGKAYANEGNKVYLVDENFKILKKIDEEKIYYSSDAFEKNGLITMSLEKGEKLMDSSGNEILRSKDRILHITGNLYLHREVQGFTTTDHLYDATGKLIGRQDRRAYYKEFENYYVVSTDEHYYYFDNDGNLIGKSGAFYLNF